MSIEQRANVGLPEASLTEFGSSLAVRNDLQRLLAELVPVPGALPIKKILIPEPMGVCAGVEMAIDSLNEVVERFPEREIIGYHGIVHNPYVTNRFQERGVEFVDDVDKAPSNSIIVLSPHGSSPEVIRKAKEHDRTVIDAVCPLVEKVHHEVVRMVKEGRIIIHIAHAGHDEALGVQGYVPKDKYHRIETLEELEEVKKQYGPDTQAAVVTQTTLAQGSWESIAEAAKEYWTDTWTAPRKDICYATDNRQSAVEQLVLNGGIETVLVVTSEQSSNGKALVRKAREAGAESFLIQNPQDINLIEDLIRGKKIGITAGASTPAQQVAEIISYLDPSEGIEFLSGKVEEQKFSLPRELRDLIKEDDARS